MATADCVLESLTGMDRFVVLMIKARAPSDIVDAVRAYLADWPAARIARVQLIDAGWAPFDDRQRPIPIIGSLDVHQICSGLRGQVMSLRESGVAPTPEFLELELVFFVAKHWLESLGRDCSAAHAASGGAVREMPTLHTGN